MPTYEYQCSYCKTITELIRKPHRVPKKTLCKKPGCNRLARRILSRVSIKCDSINDVPWLASAKQNLPDDAKHIETRGQHEKYLKDNDLVCKG